MRYFVTGATGFIGGELVRQLRTAGDEVVALVRDRSRARDLAALGVELADGNITRRETLRDPMSGADGVYHLAAWYQVGTDPAQAHDINVEGTRNVLETMRDLGIARGVYTSSLATNSDTKGRIVDESYRYNGPHLSIYDETKWRAHYEVALPLIRDGLPLVVVMPGAVYGPGDTSQLGALMREALSGKLVTVPGEPTGLSWAHVQDVALGHRYAMQQGRVGESYIIGGSNHTYREAFQLAAAIRGRRLRAIWVPPAAMGVMATLIEPIERITTLPANFTAEAMRVTGGTTYYGDNAKARRELGYEPRSLAEGFRETFADDGSDGVTDHR